MVLGNSTGAKSRALARARQAEGTNQHYRDANTHNSGKLPMLLVHKPTLRTNRAKIGGQNAMKHGQLKKK